MASLAGAQGHRLYSALESVHPHSMPGPVVSTPDGSIVFVAESGVLAVIDVEEGQSGFEQPVKIEAIASQGVRAVELLLDPDADLEQDPDGPEALLYVAGGRLGLWAIRADPRANEPMLATRIDAGVIQGQSERTWCNSLEILEIGETRYLAALFAREGCSRLRLYALSAVRSRFDSTVVSFAETGNELSPAADVGVGGNCTWQTPRYGSFGYGMAVDGAKVYLAMGRYGLVRVSFTSTTTFSVAAGPYFGTGSYYQHSVHSGYSDYEYRSELPTGYEVTRHEPPQFVDVAVQDDETRELLWVAVDNVGLVAFDLTDSWSTQMDIVHQEGRWVDSEVEGIEDTHVRLVKLGQGGETQTEMIRNYAHRLSIAWTSDGESSGQVLAVGVNSLPLLVSDSILDEGRTLGQLGIGYQGTTGAIGSTPTSLQLTWEEEAEFPSVAPGDPAYEYTLLYDVTNLELVPPSSSEVGGHQHLRFLRQGGRHVHLPAEQPEGEIVVLGTQTLGKLAPSNTFLARYETPFSGGAADLPDELLERATGDRPGWNSYDISYSPGNPELLYLGSTDAGVVSGGILATCGSEYARFYEGPGGDGRATFGILFNPHAVWAAPIVEEKFRDFIFGAGRPPNTQGTGFLKPHWMLVHFDPGEDLCDLVSVTREPERLKRIYVQSPLDRFRQSGRGYYSGSGGIDAGYDAHVVAQEGTPLAFVCRSATPAGIYVVNREELESIILDSGTSDQDVVLTEDVGVYFRELLTHPEYANVYNNANPTCPDQNEPLCNFLGKNKLNGRVITFFPRLMEIPAPEESEEDLHWILAVPSGAVQLPDLDTFTNGHATPKPEWAPDTVFRPSHFYDHAMVRVFDVHDYDTITSGTIAPSAYTLLGPREGTAAIRVEPLNWNDRSFLFVSDFSTSVLAWEITGLLDKTPGAVIDPDDNDYGSFMLEEWITPFSISDGLPNNVWHIAVAHEVWNDGTTERDEVYVYVAVGRYGIAVLRFDPDAASGQRLVLVHSIKTPSGMGGLRIRENETLLFAESLAGIRTFVRPQ